jgi:mono/diheme cytochrome c family protein
MHLSGPFLILAEIVMALIDEKDSKTAGAIVSSEISAIPTAVFRAAGYAEAAARMKRYPARKRGAISLAMGLVLLFVGLSPSLAHADSDASSDNPAPAATFSKRCAGCHTYGKGIRVGPDLKGVTDRHPRDWLLRFIRSSQSVIQSGDPVAAELFLKFNQQKMPDHDLSPEQIGSLIDYLARGGPEAKAPDERDASQATASEIQSGRLLFFGGMHFAQGGAACSSCHSIRENGVSQGGSLGPDLTAVYPRYRDVALTSFLKTSCFLRTPESSGTNLLTPQEAFDLKAYFRRVAQGPTNSQGINRRQERAQTRTISLNESAR